MTTSKFNHEEAHMNEYRRKGNAMCIDSHYYPLYGLKDIANYKLKRKRNEMFYDLEFYLNKVNKEKDKDNTVLYAFCLTNYFADIPI